MSVSKWFRVSLFRGEFCGGSEQTLVHVNDGLDPCSGDSAEIFQMAQALAVYPHHGHDNRIRGGGFGASDKTARDHETRAGPGGFTEERSALHGDLRTGFLDETTNGHE